MNKADAGALERARWRGRWHMECIVLGAFIFWTGILMPDTGVWKTGFCVLVWGSLGLGMSAVYVWIIKRRNDPARTWWRN